MTALSRTARTLRPRFLLLAALAAGADCDKKEPGLPRVPMSAEGYTPAQAQKRADGKKEGLAVHPKRGDAAPLFAKCMQADYARAQTPRAADALWQGWTLAAAAPLTAGRLADFAARADVFYCFDDLDPRVSGLMLRGEGVALFAANEKADPAALFLTTVHETTHVMQEAAGLGGPGPDWSPRDVQASLLAKEAAARGAECVAAVEASLHGVPEPLRSAASASCRREKVLGIYGDARAAGLSPLEALAAVGLAAWRDQLKDRSWLDFYNDRALSSFLTLGSGMEMPGPDGKGFTLDDARKTGRLSPAFNFTAALEALPSSEMLFGGNARMQAAFDYAELERMALKTGRADGAYLDELARLEKAFNPYLGVDLARIALALELPHEKTALELMDCAAGLVACPGTFTSFDSAFFKVELRPALKP